MGLEEIKPAKLNKKFSLAFEELKELHKLCSDSEISGAYHTSPVADISNVLHKLLVEMKVKPGSRVLDLGCGLGFPLLAFAYAGLRAYGVDENFDVLRAADWNIRHAPQVLEKYFEHEPKLMCGNYLGYDFPGRKFSDGFSPREMDIFFCYCYDGGHHNEIARFLFYAKPGSILALPQSLFSADFLRENKFKAFNSRDKESYLVKTGEKR